MKDIGLNKVLMKRKVSDSSKPIKDDKEDNKKLTIHDKWKIDSDFIEIDKGDE
jgi:hypothetical protein